MKPVIDIKSQQHSSNQNSIIGQGDLEEDIRITNKLI